MSELVKKGTSHFDDVLLKLTVHDPSTHQGFEQIQNTNTNKNL